MDTARNLRCPDRHPDSQAQESQVRYRVVPCSNGYAAEIVGAHGGIPLQDELGNDLSFTTYDEARCELLRRVMLATPVKSHNQTKLAVEEIW